MKKIASLLLTMFLIGQVVTPIHASNVASSITNYGEGNTISGDCKVQHVKLSESLEGLAMASEDGIILEGNSNFKITTSYPVKDFIILDDVDEDGIKDIAVYLDVKDEYDNFEIISSKESKVLYKTKFVYQGADENSNIVERNSFIRQMLYEDGNIYMIYDYHLLAMDAKSQKIVFDHLEKDNIWKMIIVENQIMYTNQLGSVVSLDKKSGKEIFNTQITSFMYPIMPYRQESNKVAMNTWDIAYLDGSVYVTSEDGNLTSIDITSGEVVNTLPLEATSEEEILARLANYYMYDQELKTEVVLTTGPFSTSFMGFKIRAIKENLAIVEVYLGDIQQQTVSIVDSQQGKKPNPVLVVVDLKEWKVKTKISLEQYNVLASNALLGQYEGKEALLVATTVSQGSLKINAYSIDDGQLLGQRTIRNGSIPGENVKLVLENDEDSYLLKIGGVSTFRVASDLKSMLPLQHSIIANVVCNVADGSIVSYQEDGKVTQIKKLGLNGKEDVLAQTNLPTGYSSLQGFESIVFEESKNQILSLVNEINTNNEVVASHILIIDMTSGAILQDRKILLDKGRDENNQYYEHYLQGESIRYFSDVNKDGKTELLVDENIIDGASFTVKGSYKPSVEENGLLLMIGDLNKDGISDAVSVGETQMRVYYSNRNDFEITYTKSDIVKKYDKGLQNQVYAKVLGDFDHDGVDDFVINAKNDAGYQYYQVINAKDLSVRFHLMEDGVYDWGESFALLNQDVNHDGYDELVFNGVDSKVSILSGKDGSTLLTYTTYEGSYTSNESSPPMLDNMLGINILEKQNTILQLEDYNEDGTKDIGYSVIKEVNRNAKVYLVIRDGQTLEPLDEVLIQSLDATGGFSGEPIIPVRNQTKIIYKTLEETGYSQIYDYKNKTLVSGCKIEVTYARGLNNGEIQVQNSQNEIYGIGDGQDFTITNLEDKATIRGNLTLKYESDKSGILSVYDQGTLVAKTTDKTVTVALLVGEHTLTFSYDDGHGKVTHQTRQIQVEKGNMLRYITMFASLTIVLVGILYTFYPKYKLMKKAGVKHG